MLPSVGDHISHLYLNQPSFIPVLLPPGRTVIAIPIPLPLGREMGRHPCAGYFAYPFYIRTLMIALLVLFL